MSKTLRKPGRGPPPPDVKIVYDCCGVDVNDPLGNHTVNFSFEVTASDDPTKTFEGDIELVFPHNLPKSFKPPKIDITKPETRWQYQMSVLIDDVFLNTVKEKRLIYKLVFVYKAVTHGPKSGGRAPPKRAQDKSSTLIVNHTFFVDATCLFVRGGRFKPFLSASASCKPPGFLSFSMSIKIDHPLLSDAQIRRFQPVALYFKGIHQLPGVPISYEALAASYVGPFIIVRGAPQPLMTVPVQHGPEMKLNIAVVLWAPTITDIRVELHDRDSEPPDLLNTIGSAFVSPTDTTQKVVKVEPLSIDQILGTKQLGFAPPYAAVNVPLETGRKLLPLIPVMARDSLTQQGFFIEAGTYLVVEIETMKSYVPQLPVAPVVPVVAPKKAPAGHPAKTPVPETKPTFFFRRCIIYSDGDELTDAAVRFLDSLEETIIRINATVMNVRDIATVPSMKVEKEEAPAITGFIFMAGTLHIIILEVLEGAESEAMLSSFLSPAPDEPSPPSDIVVLQDFAQHFQSPRIYHTFDCAVKKFKLSKPLDVILADPSVYLQNSHLSNCFLPLNQLNQLRRLTKFDRANEYKLWPNAQHLEMINAKLGSLLSMAELSFPPKRASSTAGPASLKSECTEHEEAAPSFVYLPVNEQREATPPRGWDHFSVVHQAQIKRSHDRRRWPPRECVASDGEVEIWKNPPDPVALDGNGWVLERPVPYIPIAEAVDMQNYLKQFRITDGSEVRGSSKFYSFNTPKTTLPPVTQLKTDQNKESWKDGDLSLATGEQRWLSNVRGPIRSAFTPDVHPRDVFEVIRPITLEEPWKPPIHGTGPRSYAIPGVAGRRVFCADIPPGKKNDCLLRNSHEEPAIRIQEEYRDPPVIDKLLPPPTRGHKRFHSVFPNSPPKKGATDSHTVRRLRPTFIQTP
jgi:hypothetical protein